PLREVARAAGVTPTTVQRWTRKYADAPPPAEPTIAERAAALAANAPAADDHDAPEDDGDSLAQLKRMQREMQAMARQARQEGNYTAAQRAMRDAGALAPVIARLEKVAADESDVLRISRAEIDRTMVDLEARIKAMLDRPLMCAECSRKLSIAWGQASEPTEDHTDE